jgi:hypothetical protein
VQLRWVFKQRVCKLQLGKLDRVTRWVCEKISQNVAQPGFVEIKVQYILRKKVAQNFGQNFNTLTKLNNCSLGDNSLNLATLKLKNSPKIFLGTA